MQNQSNQNEMKVSKKSWTVTILLLFFLGWGFHRIYVGKVGTGILWMLTGGCFFVGAFLDLYKLLTNNFTDKDGAYLIRK